MYWLLNPDLGLPEEEQTVKAQNNQLAEGDINSELDRRYTDYIKK